MDTRTNIVPSLTSFPLFQGLVVITEFQFVGFASTQEKEVQSRVCVKEGCTPFDCTVHADGGSSGLVSKSADEAVLDS